MRLDHIAYRVKDRAAAIKFFKDALGYKEQTQFEIKLEDGSTAECTAMEPPEKTLGAPFVTRPGMLMSLAFAPKMTIHDFLDIADGLVPSREIPRSIGWPARIGKWLLKTGRKLYAWTKEVIKIANWRKVEYHMAPEIFVSQGPPGGLIERWVENWCPGRAGGIHHLAYEVDNVDETMKEWKAQGFLFTTEDPLDCGELRQCFTMPNPFTGVIYEFIERRGANGFCKDNVAKLMNSTSQLS